MNIDEDTSEWLGCPTPLEMYKHQCALLEEEIASLRNDLLRRESWLRSEFKTLTRVCTKSIAAYNVGSRPA